MSSKRAILPSSSRARLRSTAVSAWLNNASLRVRKSSKRQTVGSSATMVDKSRSIWTASASNCAAEMVRGWAARRGRRGRTLSPPGLPQAVAGKFGVDEAARNPAKLARRRGDLVPGVGRRAAGRTVAPGVQDLDQLAAVQPDLDHVANVAEAAAHAGGHVLFGHRGDVLFPNRRYRAETQEKLPGTGRMASQPPGSWR